MTVGKSQIQLKQILFISKNECTSREKFKSRQVKLEMIHSKQDLEHLLSEFC